MKTAWLSLFGALILACGSDSAGGGAPVIEDVDIPGQGPKGADGKYDVTLIITASDDGKIVSARIDSPSSDPPSFVGTEVPINEQKIARKSVLFKIDGAVGPGTGDANLVLTDDSGQVAKKKIVITTRD